MPCPSNGKAETFTDKNPCTWTRKLCVSCFEDTEGTVKVKVQSNAMPNHCFNGRTTGSKINFASPKETEWQVNWNPDVNDIQNYQDRDFDSQAKTSEILCDIQRTSSKNMNEASQYEVITESRSLDPIATSAGIALTGAYIYNALALGNVDAIEEEGEGLDVCLSHSSPQGDFHYHFSGACMKKNLGSWSDSEAPALCKDEKNCLLNTGSYVRGASSNG